MYLKRLELHGFKSFADSTVLEFKPGITAVVGPNGSGKSNISDALLWVLGEQNVRHLRGEGSQDVIFAGTDRRRPLGMAEVSVCLDNSSGLLPVDFSEVTVTRRVFRDGEAEFFINRTPCRLRDVYELFLDTGVGRDAYSIIGQNQIEAVLSSRGEERRQLFEEAAGVKKYRHRRRETERKLDATRRNLTRVADILAEVEEQIGPLEAQAQVAAKYNELSSRLRSLELGLLAADARRHRSELDRLRTERGQIESDAESLSSRISLLQAEEQRLRAELAVLEHEADDLRQASEQAKQDLLRAEGRLALCRQEARAAQIERERAAGEASRLEERLATLRRELAEAEETLQRRESEAALAEQAASDALPHLKEAEQRSTLVLSELDECQRRAAAAGARRAAVEQQVRAAETRLADAEARSAREAERRRALLADRDAANAEVERLQSEVASLKAASADADSALRAVDSALADAQRALADARKRERDLQQSALRLSSRLKSLQEMHANLEGTYRGVRAVIQAARSGAIRGSYRLVADLLGVPDEYRVAIEVALGAHAQDIVTQTDAEAQAAIALLKQRGLGRATFLPLDLLRGDKLRPIRQPGVVGLACDLVYFPADVAKAIDVLLGRIVVVEDLQTAIRLVRQGAIGGARMVTLDGELINPSGSITGGSKEQTAGILSRKLEIDKLAKEAAAEAAALRRAEDAAAKAEETCAALQSKREDARTRVAELRLQLGRAETAYEHALSNARRLEEQLRAHPDEDADALAAVREGLLSLQKQLAEAERESSAAAAEEAGRRQAVQGVLSALEKARAEAAELQLQSARARERATAARQAVQRASSAVHDGEAELTRMRTALASMHASQTDADREREAAAEVESLRALAAEAERRAEAKREQRSAALKRLGDLTMEVKRASDERQSLVERGHRMEVREATMQADLAHVQERLRQEYQVDPAEAVATLEPPARGTATEVARLKTEIAALGTVNLGAIEEFERLTNRRDFLLAQRDDLEEAERKLRAVISEIDEATKETFYATYRRIERSFDQMFQRLFGGGKTQLVITDPNNLLETGIDIIVQPPGKKLQHLQLLSGGEKALTAVALLFALLDVKPSPFCLLDEVDAALDEANVERFAEVVKDFALRSQFLVITHNKATMSAADTLCGVTMEEPGVSKVISIRMQDFQPAS